MRSGNGKESHCWQPLQQLPEYRRTDFLRDFEIKTKSFSRPSHITHTLAAEAVDALQLMSDAHVLHRVVKEKLL
jgi:hypothetical protein